MKSNVGKHHKTDYTGFGLDGLYCTIHQLRSQSGCRYELMSITNNICIKSLNMVNKLLKYEVFDRRGAFFRYRRFSLSLFLSLSLSLSFSLSLWVCLSDISLSYFSSGWGDAILVTTTVNRPMLPLLKFAELSDVYISPCVIRNSRINRNARFSFLCMQLPWLENWKGKVETKNNFFKKMTCLENLYLRTESLDGDSMEREEFRREADRLSLVHECQVHSAVP